MSMRFRAAAAAAVGLASVGMSQAQVLPGAELRPMSFAQTTSRETWRTIMLISAIVAVVGVLDDNGTLIILGVGGVVLSLVETGHLGFQMRARHGFDLVKSGPLSFGINPYGPMKVDHGFYGTRPGAFMQLTFKF